MKSVMTAVAEAMVRAELSSVDIADNRHNTNILVLCYNIIKHR